MFTIKTGQSTRLHVELPGLTNVDDAVNLIGQTAQNFFGLKDLPKEASDSAVLDDYYLILVSMVLI